MIFRLMEGAKRLKCSEFGHEIVKIWFNILLDYLFFEQVLINHYSTNRQRF